MQTKMGRRTKDISGMRFDKWTVLSFDKVIDNKAIWNCVCDCGVEKSVRGDHLRNGRSRSCGCNIGPVKTHGHNLRSGESPTYQSWAGMMQRCNNPNADWYSYYGGRGITVCNRWKDFRFFLLDMGERPENTTLDRKNNNGIYCKDNCRWATVEEQNINKRSRGTAINIPVFP